jgi:hypothetical protein
MLALHACTSLSSSRSSTFVSAKPRVCCFIINAADVQPFSVEHRLVPADSSSTPASLNARVLHVQYFSYVSVSKDASFQVDSSPVILRFVCTELRNNTRVQFQFRQANLDSIHLLKVRFLFFAVTDA